MMRALGRTRVPRVGSSTEHSRLQGWPRARRGNSGSRSTGYCTVVSTHWSRRAFLPIRRCGVLSFVLATESASAASQVR